MAGLKISYQCQRPNGRIVFRMVDICKHDINKSIKTFY